MDAPNFWQNMKQKIISQVGSASTQWCHGEVDHSSKLIIESLSNNDSELLKGDFRTASNFIGHIPSPFICQMLANFFGVEWTVSKFKKRKRKLLSINDCSCPRQKVKLGTFTL